MIQNIKLILAECFHKLNYVAENRMRNLERKIIKGLKTNGYYVLESFLSEEECAKLRNRTDRFIQENIDKISLESNGNDKRVYGVNRYDDRFVINKIEAISDKIYNKFSFIYKKDYFYLLGKIIAGKENLGSGSGWHRDSPISNQFKTILYLSDVSNSNGPFQYIRETHNYSSILRINNFLKKPLNQMRFSNNEIEKLIKNNIVSELHTFTALQGTLIFVNTRGLHRGAPLEKGNRYALTRYHFARKNKKFNK